MLHQVHFIRGVAAMRSDTTCATRIAVFDGLIALSVSKEICHTCAI